MKILIITHFFPPGHTGGTETLTAALARALLKQGHVVQVLCAEDWDSAPGAAIVASDDSFQGVPVRRLHFNWKRAPDVFRYTYNNPAVEAWLDAYLAQDRPDVVHITSCYSLSASVVTAAKRAGLPVVLTATDFWFLCNRNTLLQSDGQLCSGPESAWKCARCNLQDSKFYRWPGAVLPEKILAPALLRAGKAPLITRQPGVRGMHGDWDDRFAFLRAALGQVDVIVTASRLLQDMLAEYGVPAGRIRFSPYGFDTEWAQASLDKPASDTLRLGFIGQMIPMKGPDILIRAVKALEPDAPVALKLYGSLDKEPAYGQQLRALASDDPRISFMGMFPHHEIGAVLAGMDALIVPSIWYDFPLVIPSAFATRTPVIATDMPGMNELVHSEADGLLFERGSSGALAGQIRRLLDEPGLLAALRAGIAPVKTVGAMLAEYEALYAVL